MLTQIKKYLPRPVKQVIYKIYKRTIAQWEKQLLFLLMKKKHKELVAKKKSNKRICIIFLVIHKSVWKVDAVFKTMLADSFFEPIIIVCPDTVYGGESMFDDMNDCLLHFRKKGYPTYSSFDSIKERWIKLEEMKPDIIFFTNPHDLTRKEYYEDAYFNYLSCYVPYFMLTTTHGGDESIYNYPFHNAMWKIFMPHEFSLSTAKKVSAAKARNCFLTGYPACEAFFNQSNKVSVWKKQVRKKKKIIFAPHHSIFEGELMLSNFLSVARPIQFLAEHYKDEIQWSFKPHPLLKSKLFLHSAWGEKKTLEYYDWWEGQSFTQYDDGEYFNLFLESDTIIHDCSSFIAEYLFLMRPSAYIVMNGESQLDSINDFGKFSLKAYVKICDVVQLKDFIEGIKNNSININADHMAFFSSHVAPLLLNDRPSEKIIELIKTAIK